MPLPGPESLRGPETWQDHHVEDATETQVQPILDFDEDHGVTR